MSILLFKGYGTSKSDYKRLVKLINKWDKLIFEDDLSEDQTSDIDIIIGHSFGAYKAMQFLDVHKDLQAKVKLVLVSPLLKLPAINLKLIINSSLLYIYTKIVTFNILAIFSRKDFKTNQPYQDYSTDPTQKIICLTTKDVIVSYESQEELANKLKNIIAIRRYPANHNFLDLHPEEFNNLLKGV